ncbi:hypothetical protein D9M68_802570 [compost metagenome]
MKVTKVPFDDQQRAAQDQRGFQPDLVMPFDRGRKLAAVRQCLDEMAQVDRQGFQLVFAIVRTPAGKVLSQFFQVRWDSVRVVEQLI